MPTWLIIPANIDFSVFHRLNRLSQNHWWRRTLFVACEFPLTSRLLLLDLDWFCTFTESVRAFLRLPTYTSLSFTSLLFSVHIVSAASSPRHFSSAAPALLKPNSTFLSAFISHWPIVLISCLPDAADHHLWAGNSGQGHGGKRSGPDWNSDGHHHHRRQEWPRAWVHTPTGEGQVFGLFGLLFWLVSVLCGVCGWRYWVFEHFFQNVLFHQF